MCDRSRNQSSDGQIPDCYHQERSAKLPEQDPGTEWKQVLTNIIHYNAGIGVKRGNLFKLIMFNRHDLEKYY